MSGITDGAPALDDARRNAMVALLRGVRVEAADATICLTAQRRLRRPPAIEIHHPLRRSLR